MNNLGEGIQQVTSKDALSQFFNGICELYDLCFGVAPYFEDVPIETVRDIFENCLANGVVFLYLDNNAVVGFSAAIPLSCRKDVYEIVKEHLTGANDYWYHAEIGVHPERRGMGIAKKLLQTVLEISRAPKMLMRTSEKNVESLSLHKKFDFKMLNDRNGTPVTQDVQNKRIDGKIGNDKRIFMLRDLSIGLDNEMDPR
jgi:ribosomal protein S18 acetylase RimI-like enzyme